jgi:DNA-binding GntR family transcriptional regulator
LSEQAFQLLKYDIVWCHLVPGAEISEAQLAEKYGFGKAPIRQALSRLTQERYVVAVPRRGHIISPVTLQSVKDLFELRLVVEPAIAQSVSGRVNGSRLRELDQLCLQGYEPGNEHSEAAFMEVNREFHLEIARASGNERILHILSQIMDEMARLLHLGFVLRERPGEMVHEHRELVDALVQGDKQKAYEAASTHIKSVRALVIDGIIANTNLTKTLIVPA